MFWRKRTYTDSQLGTLRYSWGRWGGETKAPDGTVLLLGMARERDRPDPRALEKLRESVLSDATWKQAALAYLWAREDVPKFAADRGDLVLESLTANREGDAFNVMFYFTKGEDNFVAVDFTAGRPGRVTWGDWPRYEG